MTTADEGTEPVRFAGYAATPGLAGRVRVTYSAGMVEDASDVPDAIQHAIIRFAGELHASREGLEPELPASVVALLRPWRRLALA